MSDDSADGPIHLITVDGVDLEATWTRSPEPTAVAVITHPHPLMGGDMHNPVPAGLARALAAAGVSALRANFRGTGASGGVHDEGRSEQLDVVAMIDAATGGIPVIGVGYSFGADVLLAVDDERLAGVVAVAPPLRVLDLETLAAPRGRRPTLLLSPEHDQFRDAVSAREAADSWPATQVAAIPGADHFLAGSIGAVVDRVIDFVDRLLSA